MKSVTLTRPRAIPAGVPHVAGIEDLGASLQKVLHEAHRLKRVAARGRLPPLLAGRAVVLLFDRPSTRTRISFEIGIQRLGGIVSTLDGATSQLGRGESLEDTAQVLGRYADAIVYRAASHGHFTEMARHSPVPVVNALTDLEHPCQVLADWLTLEEHWGDLRGRRFAYVGDGNNMCHSYLLAAPLAGMDIHVATPAGYGPDAGIVAKARRLARQNGTQVTVGHDPKAAVRKADAVATDTWISMGDEADAAARRIAFSDYTVTETLMADAARDALFLHCLPGHWGEEATHDVAHGPRSVIYDQAENRMWAQMALLCHLIGNGRPEPW